MSADVVGIVKSCLRDIGEQQDIHLPEVLDADCALFGEQGLFDSLGLVNLVVAVEEAVEDRLDVSISLADQRALSQKHSPYRTVGALADYASRLIQEASAQDSSA